MIAPSEHLAAAGVIEKFREFDSDENGVIDREELATMLQRLDAETFSDSNIDLLLAAVDKNGDGIIQLEEFMAHIFSGGGRQGGKCSNGHALTPLGTSRDNGWRCNGGSEPGGCKGGYDQFHSTGGVNRFRCKPCDYDLCEVCFRDRAGKITCHDGHPLVPLGLSRDRRWVCNGSREDGGCLSGITSGAKSSGCNRFRCHQCDYDLCEPCHNSRAEASVNALMLPAAGGGARELSRSVSEMMGAVPKHWDMPAMQEVMMRSGTGLDVSAGNVVNMFAKIPLGSDDLEGIQALFDASYRKVYTRDRKGAAVPDRLVVEKGFRIQNAQNWSEYMERSQQVREHLERLRLEGSSGFCNAGHVLEPLGVSRDNGWACDGRKEVGGCQSGLTGFHQSQGMNRFRCSTCDYDLCEKCYLMRTGRKLCGNGHALVPIGLGRDNGWFCDGRKHPEGCLNGITSGAKSKGVNRFRCFTCDYDLCDKCYKRHMGSVNSSIASLKTDGILSHEEFELDKEINTVWLFHGTSSAAGEAICQGDFLINKAGSNAGTLYGRGVYLAESCSKSDEYSTENEEGQRCMLLCRTTLGNVLYCDAVSPPVDYLVHLCVSGPFHSVLGDREKARGTYREFIVYDDDQVYPEFLLWYRRQYG